MISPEKIRLASGHSTSKAFERYFTLEPDDLRKTYGMTRENQNGKAFEICKFLKLQHKNGGGGGSRTLRHTSGFNNLQAHDPPSLSN